MRKARYKDRAKLRGESEEKNGELPFYPPQTERKGMSKREREREREVQETRRTRRDRRMSGLMETKPDRRLNLKPFVTTSLKRVNLTFLPCTRSSSPYSAYFHQ